MLPGLAQAQRDPVEELCRPPVVLSPQPRKPSTSSAAVDGKASPARKRSASSNAAEKPAIAPVKREDVRPNFVWQSIYSAPLREAGEEIGIHQTVVLAAIAPT